MQSTLLEYTLQIPEWTCQLLDGNPELQSKDCEDKLFANHPDTNGRLEDAQQYPCIMVFTELHRLLIGPREELLSYPSTSAFGSSFLLAVFLN